VVDDDAAVEAAQGVAGDFDAGRAADEDAGVGDAVPGRAVARADDGVADNTDVAKGGRGIPRVDGNPIRHLRRAARIDGRVRGVDVVVRDEDVFDAVADVRLHVDHGRARGT
jgi:hypothetical protein